MSRLEPAELSLRSVFCCFSCGPNRKRKCLTSYLWRGHRISYHASPLRARQICLGDGWSRAIRPESCRRAVPWGTMSTCSGRTFWIRLRLPAEKDTDKNHKHKDAISLSFKSKNNILMVNLYASRRLEQNTKLLSVCYSQMPNSSGVENTAGFFATLIKFLVSFPVTVVIRTSCSRFLQCHNDVDMYCNICLN